MTVLTFMIMNVGAVVYLCVTDVVARMLVAYSCSPAHGACKSLEIFLVCLLQLCVGLSQLYLLTLALTWVRKYSGVTFFSDCDSAFSR